MFKSILEKKVTLSYELKNMHFTFFGKWILKGVTGSAPQKASDPFKLRSKRILRLYNISLIINILLQDIKAELMTLTIASLSYHYSLRNQVFKGTNKQ